MRINHNMTAMNTYRQLSINEANQSKTMQQLSTGKRINSAADDAAGYSISTRMESQIRGLNQASSNAQNGISLVQTAQGALGQTSDILQRMRELAVQAGDGSLTSTDRTSVQGEVDQLRQQIDKVSTDTQFNGRTLLNGSVASTTSVSGTNASHIDASKTIAGTATQTGVYNVTFTTAATQATIGTGATATANTTALTLASTATAGQSGNVLINGTAVNIANGDSMSAILTKINAASNQTGVTASFNANGGNGFIQLNSNGYGSNSTINLQGSSPQLSGLFAAQATASTATVTSAAGTDATGTINGVAASGVGNTLTLHSVGNAADGLTVKGFDSGANAVANGDTATVVVDTSNGLSIQTGANAGQNISFNIGNMSASSLGVAGNSLTSGLDMSSTASATTALTAIDNAINTVAAQNSQLGSIQNRFNYTVQNLNTQSQNTTAAQSQITDVDMAQAVMENSKNSILSQAAQAMLAQAKSQPQSVLQLLQG